MSSVLPGSVQYLDCMPCGLPFYTGSPVSHLMLHSLSRLCHVDWLYNDSARTLCDSAVREMAARLLGIVTMALSADSASSLLARMCDSGDRSSKFEAMEGNLAATGFALAQLSTGAESLAQASPGCAACVLLVVLLVLMCPLMCAPSFQSWEAWPCLASVL